MNRIMNRTNIGRYALVLLMLSILMASIPAASAWAQITKEGTSGKNGWYVSEVKATLLSNNKLVYQIVSPHGPFDNNAWKEYTGPFTIKDDGHYTVHYREIGNWGFTDYFEEIDEDKTPPSNTPNMPPPNSYGWYKYNPTANFVCNDGLTGSGCIAANANIIVETPPKPPTNDGPGLSTCWEAEDFAGNKNKKCVTANVDKQLPYWTLDDVSPPVPNGNNGWWTVPVIVKGTIYDDISGLIPDGAKSKPFRDVLTENNNCAFQGQTDRAGNGFAITLCYNIDQTKPTIEISGTSASGLKLVDGGIYKERVNAIIGIFDAYLDPSKTKITLNGADYKSGDPVDTPVGTSQDYELKVSACDLAGNCNDASIKFAIDKILPTIELIPREKPNANGWYNKDIVVDLKCKDNKVLGKEDNIKSCADIDGKNPIVISTEGQNIYVTGYVVDTAGNKNSANAGPFNLDKTPPKVIGAALQQPDLANGWYSFNPDVKFDASDAPVPPQSGIDGPAIKTIPTTGEGIISASATFSDKAGNSATGIVTVKVEKGQPKITITGVEDGKTYNTPVTPKIEIDAGPSGVKTQSIKLNGLDFVSGNTISANGDYKLEVSVANNAGKNANQAVNFKVDIVVVPGPTIDITGVEDGKTYTTAVTPKVIINAPAGIKEQIITLNGASFTSGTTISANGNYKLSAEVTDNNKKVASKTVSFTVAITSPTSPIQKATGAGTIASPKNSKKVANFDFQAKIKDSKISGYLKYTDIPSNIKLTGGVVKTLKITDDKAVFTGTGKIGTKTVNFEVTVEDNGTPGKNNDKFSIKITGSGYNYQSGNKLLKSGNIKVIS
jgi:hypothetical protein